MKWSQVGSQQCSIARTLSVIGDSWTMLIVRELFNGNRRFNGLLDETSAPSAILSERLGVLEREGVVDKRPYSARTDRFEYRLSAKGRDLYPILLTLMAWGDRWMANGAAPPVQAPAHHLRPRHHDNPHLLRYGHHIQPARHYQMGQVRSESTVTYLRRSPASARSPGGAQTHRAQSRGASSTAIESTVAVWP